MEIVLGFEGNVEKFIERVKDIWQKEGKRGNITRYELLIGKMNGRAMFKPTVTSRGIKTLVIYNIDQEGINKIKEAAKEAEIPVIESEYLWFDSVPIFPHEQER